MVQLNVGGLSSATTIEDIRRRLVEAGGGGGREGGDEDGVLRHQRVHYGHQGRAVGLGLAMGIKV